MLHLGHRGVTEEGTTVMRIRTATAVAALALALAACSSSDDTADDTSAPPASQPAEAPDAEPVDVDESDDELPDGDVPVIGVGESATVTVTDTTYEGTAELTVTVDDIEYPDGPRNEDGTDRPADGHYVRLTLTVANTGADGDAMFSPYGNMMWETPTHAGQEVSTLNFADGPSVDTTYRPGQSVTGAVILDVPERTGTVTYLDGWAPAVTIALPDA